MVYDALTYVFFRDIHIHFNTLVFLIILLRTYMCTVRRRIFSEYRCIICI